MKTTLTNEFHGTECNVIVEGQVGDYDHTAVELDLLRAVMDGRGRGHLDEKPCRCRLCAEDRYDVWKRNQG